MSSESNDNVAPPPTSPPEINFPLPKRRDFGKERCNWSSAVKSQIPTDILLITANDHEFTACYYYMEQVQRSYCPKLGMVDFGQFGDGVSVALIKCEQGPIEALLTVKNAAEILNPRVVLFVGICASMKPTKAKHGDVVISAKLATYSDKKVTADGVDQYRGIKTKISKKMEKLILSAADGWEPPLQDPSSLKVDVHRDAVMLSGPELVDNRERREELAGYFRDALGLEMEGAGLYAAARDLEIEWAVIKAVSDFADGSKSVTKDWQPFASVMAASVVHNMFKHADVINQWPHYKNIDPGMAEDTIDAKKRKREESSNEDIKYKRQKESQPASEMCVSCGATNKNQLPDDRNKWPIDKIEISSFQTICKLLDLDQSSKVPILSALECFDRLEIATMKKQCEARGGTGIAEIALQRWGTGKRQNNVGALKKIVEETMGRVDVLDEIENWEKLCVCHGCGIKLKTDG